MEVSCGYRVRHRVSSTGTFGSFLWWNGDVVHHVGRYFWRRVQRTLQARWNREHASRNDFYDIDAETRLGRKFPKRLLVRTLAVLVKEVAV
jgi:hypothetical protein